MKLRLNSLLAALLPIAAPLALVFTASMVQAAIRTWTGFSGHWTVGFLSDESFDIMHPLNSISSQK